MSLRFKVARGLILCNGKVIGRYAPCSFGSFSSGFTIEWDNGTVALADTEAFIVTLAKQYMS